jgi:hypothetical protein
VRGISYVANWLEQMIEGSLIAWSNTRPTGK